MNQEDENRILEFLKLPQENYQCEPCKRKSLKVSAYFILSKIVSLLITAYSIILAFFIGMHLVLLSTKLNDPDYIYTWILIQPLIFWIMKTNFSICQAVVRKINGEKNDN